MQRLIELPYAYAVFGIRTRHRKPGTYCIVSTFPVLLNEVDEAPLVVTWSGVDSENRHVTEGMSAYDRDEDRGLIVPFRAFAGKLWRPLRQGILDAVPGMKEHLKDHFLTPEMFNGHLLAFCREHPVIATISLRHSHSGSEMADAFIYRLPGVGYQDRKKRWFHYDGLLTAADAHFRQKDWDNSEERRDEAAAAAVANLTLIGGILHIRTPGPVWNVEHHESRRPDGKRIHSTHLNANLGCAAFCRPETVFAADMEAEAIELARELSCGGKLGKRTGQINVCDLAAYRECSPGSEALFLSTAALMATDDTNYRGGVLPDLPPRATRLVADLAEMMEGVEIPYMPPAIRAGTERILRELDAIEATCSQMTSSDLGGLRIEERAFERTLEALAWRRGVRAKAA
jgi:hypothetical protein